MRLKKLLRSPIVTGIMFVLAVGLLCVGAIGGTQAALTIRSRDYISQINLDHIGVTLLENGNGVAWRNYGKDANSGFTDEQQNGNLILADLKGSEDESVDPQLKIGKKYQCAITASNTGGIDEYVRVIIRKYWVKDVADPGGNGWFKFNKTANTKITDDIYNPDYIQLTYGDSAFNSNQWIKDEDEKYSSEYAVYYYQGILSPGTETEPLFTDLAISNEISSYKLANVQSDGKTTIWTYAFDGYGFVIEAEVDAVQTHNRDAAINSAWGTKKGIVDQLQKPSV